MRFLFFSALYGWFSLACAQPVTELWSRGYAVIPTPQKVKLEPADIDLDGTWTVSAPGVSPAHIALRSLENDLREFHALRLVSPKPAARPIVLSIRPGAVSVPGEAAVAAQAYRIQLSNARIEIIGNSDQGLFYGVQTFLQLVKPAAGGRALKLPAGMIEDWPDLQLRFLHWDTKNHQDRMETLKRYLDWTARFKANVIGFELGDKFEFPSLPDVGAPGAFTTAQMQELTAYARERFIQLVPVIQAPSHLLYVLKHPRYAHLKADGNNYQACLCDEETYKVIFKMYDDVVKATPGVDYVFASTDEIYYASTGEKCPKPDSADLRSRLWAEFTKRAADYLQSKNRRTLAWLEYPLLAKHLDMIPSSVIDGVIGEDDYLPVERKKGMRQLGYVSTQGSEFLFPDYLPLDRELREQAAVAGEDDPIEFERGFESGRIQSLAHSLRTGRFRQGNPIGAFGAAWDDSGIHNEIFWLGWSTAASYAWNPAAPSAAQHTAEFMRVYYGPDGSAGMIDIYRAMQRQARAWQRTWDRVVSRTRGPGYGNSDGKGMGTARYDQTLPAPALPDERTLEMKPRYGRAAHLRQAILRLPENDALLHSLQEALGRTGRNRYNLEVMLTLTQFIRHHWVLLTGMAEAERTLEQAHAKAVAKQPEQALRLVANVHRQIRQIEQEGAASFRDLTAVYEKSQYPKGRSFGGKQYVFMLDDTKDHWAARTADLSYMYAPEKSIGLDKWRQQLRRVAAAYAEANNTRLPADLSTEN
ncbi:MAG: beta-N-acetylhexosaminidase [Bryobacterales bacterium]|nr:beta-N-acetylhexosaminidase [Bryobacterales bacterium]